MYKKLFITEFNNNEYLVLSKDHIKSFLKIQDGKYIYPNFDEYKYLFDMYNVDNLVDNYINFDNKVLKGNKLFSILLAADVLLGGFIGYEINENANTLNINNKIEEVIGKKEIYIDDANKIDTLMEHKDITIYEVDQAINENLNLNLAYRALLQNFAYGLLNEDINMNLRVFYDNVSTLNIIRCEKDVIKEKFNNDSDGCYDVKNNTIYLSYSADNYVLFHEFAHLLRSFYRETDKEVIIMHDKCGYAFNEAVVDNLANSIYGRAGTKYNDELRCMNFLLDNNYFDYAKYSTHGINYFVDELKERYKGVDIDYIIDFYDANYISKVKNGKNNSITSNTELTDELFKVCIYNVDPNEPQSSFNKFLNVLHDYDSNIYEKYVNRYQNYLLNNGFVNEDADLKKI